MIPNEFYLEVVEMVTSFDFYLLSVAVNYIAFIAVFINVLDGVKRGDGKTIVAFVVAGLFGWGVWILVVAYMVLFLPLTIYYGGQRE